MVLVHSAHLSAAALAQTWVHGAPLFQKSRFLGSFAKKPLDSCRKWNNPDPKAIR
jgi:hypothetical protein